MSEVIANTTIKATFAEFGSTQWFEKYMQNVYQFACAKDNALTSALLQDEVFKVSSFNEFKESASQIVDTFNDVWLRVESDTCKRSAVMGQQWQKMEQSKDIYPYWIYRGEMDDVERAEHEALEGLVFKIGDPEGDSCFPPLSFNCRCHAEEVDSDYLKENDKSVSKGEDYLTENDPETGKPYVSEEFRFNPGKQILPNDGGYFDVSRNLLTLTNEDYE